jgi:hypothetical protein
MADARVKRENLEFSAALLNAESIVIGHLGCESIVPSDSERPGQGAYSNDLRGRVVPGSGTRSGKRRDFIE